MISNPILFEVPETLETNRLWLKVPQAGYGLALHEAILDGYVDYIQWLNRPSTTPTFDKVEEDCRKHHAEFILRDCIRYLIIEKQSNQIVGRCGFPPPQTLWNIPQFGISYFIRKSARNQGFATEAVHALTHLAFQKFQAKKVSIYCDAENSQSQKIPQKLGFQLECTQKGGWPRPDQQLATLHLYAMFSDTSLINPFLESEKVRFISS